MKVIEVANQIEGGQVAFGLLKEKLEQGAKTLGLATGSSPLEFYKLIRESNLDFSDMVSVNLDEYVGLTGEDPQSYRYFMQENLFNKKKFNLWSKNQLMKKLSYQIQELLSHHQL